MRRGEVWWADVGRPVGSEPGYRRPVLVVQADPFNKSNLSTVVVVPLTRNLRLAAAPGNVALAARQTGLRARSVANVSQLAVLDRSRFVEKIGALPGANLQQVAEGMRLVVGL